MKVLGVKIDDETYTRFAALDGSISDNLKKAVANYLDFIVNIPLTTHKANIPLRSYEEVTELVDAIKEV